MTIPSEIQARKNKLDGTGIWFDRVDFTFTDGRNLYISNNSEAVTVDGKDYSPVPFTVSGLEQISEAAIPTRVLSVANADIAKFLTPYIKEKDGLRGATCVITKVLYEEIAADMSDLSETYTVLNSEPDENMVSVNLGAASPMHQAVPLWRYRYTLCRWTKNFKGVACGYSGPLTTCDGTIASCKARNNFSRWGAEINLRPKTVRWV